VACGEGTVIGSGKTGPCWTDVRSKGSRQDTDLGPGGLRAVVVMDAGEPSCDPMRIWIVLEKEVAFLFC
jgi:hypothetical protein